MDANDAIMHLRSLLLSSGMSEEDADSRCDAAAQELSDSLADLISNTLQTAEQKGIEIGATDFVAELRVNSMGGDWTVTTDSGRVDFSSGPWPMLPGLLKKGKISKEGYRYTRVPMGMSKSTPKDSMSASTQRQEVLAQAKAKISDEILHSDSSPDVNAAARDFAAAYNSTRKPKHKDRKTTYSGKPTHWVTASEKPSSKAKWIQPAKDQDASSIIAEANNELQQSVQELIGQIIARYGV